MKGWKLFSLNSNRCERVSDRGQSAFPATRSFEGRSQKWRYLCAYFSIGSRCDLVRLPCARMTLHRGVLRQKCCISKRISVRVEFAAIDATHPKTRRLKFCSIWRCRRLSGTCSERPAAASTTSLEQIMCSVDRRSSTCQLWVLSSNAGKFRGSTLAVFRLAFQQKR